MALSEQLYLENLVATGRLCNVYLNSGIKIVGVLAAHSEDVIWLQSETGAGDDLAMLYIHNVSTISPVKDRSLTRRALTELNGALEDRKKRRANLNQK
jgi:sRNA-binding regulator protein Hfq